MNFKDLHNAICTTLKKEIPAIQTCEIHPSIRKELLAPALFVELVSLESGKDPGTEELALKARFEARIVIDSTIENAAIIVRTLAAEVAKVVNKNTWNIKNVSPGEFISAEIDGFRPELDAYLVWMVDWSHQLHLGIALFTIIRTDRNMLLACYSHKHISYRIRTIIRKAINRYGQKIRLSHIRL